MDTNNQSILHYSGHPFIDVGIATLLGFEGINKRRPEDLTYNDLEHAAQTLKTLYTQVKLLQNYISIIFLNPGFVQPKHTLEQKEAYADQHLFAFRPTTPTLEDVACTFFPEKPAVMYAYRTQIPLLNGRGVSNFSPYGTPGIPVSGEALLAIHAMPLGCLKCGYLLAFHQLITPTNEGRLNLVFARRALEHNLRIIHQARLGDTDSRFDYGSHGKTRFVHELLIVKRQELRERSATREFAHITGYYFSNYGAKPALHMFHLHSYVLDFVEEAEQKASRAWNQLVISAWERDKKDPDDELDNNRIRERKNKVYEALLDLPNQAARFIRVFFKGAMHPKDFIQSPIDYPAQWKLLTIFLRKVLSMDEQTIQLIEAVAARLVGYMLEHDNAKLGFYYEFSRLSPSKVNRALRRAEEKLMKAGLEPLFTLDAYISIFHNEKLGWYLARDLVAIKMREFIYQYRERFDLGSIPEDTDTTDEDLDETITQPA